MADLNKAIEINPTLVKAYYNRGIGYDKQGKFSQAIADFSKAIEIDPKFAEAYVNRSSIYIEQGNLPEARGDLVIAIATNPKLAQAYNNLAIVYYQLKEYNKAWINLQKAGELGYAVNPELMNALKKMLHQ